jgi:tetratricopeptide (TPR) repeat protein
MRSLLCVLTLCLAASGASAAEPKDALARARLLYNEGQFEAAISAAEEGRRFPDRTDSADLIAARAYLERYRQTAAAEDLESARERLRQINPQKLNARERTELVIGLGETLFFDQSAGAAAGVFESVLTGAAPLDPEARERVLDWWASALDRDARVRTDIERPGVYQRILERMLRELGSNASSATASYWLSAAAWGQGDHQAAWDAAQAGWVRAPLASDRGAALRGDLDRLVQRAIIPERARALSQSAAVIQTEWEHFKEKWSR